MSTVRYDYRDGSGQLRYSVVRRGDGTGKTFEVLGPAGEQLENPLPPEHRILYRLPELLAVDPAVTVYIAEGEKDVDRLRAEGLVATTMPFGCLGGWLDIYTADFRGRHVVIIPDGDGPGQRHAQAVLDALAGTVRSAVIVQVGTQWNHDASSFLLSHDINDLARRVEIARFRSAGLEGAARKSDKIQLIRRAQLSALAKLLLLIAVVDEDTHHRHRQVSRRDRPDELPSRRVADLADECGCHRVTLQNTITDLRRQGILRRVSGRDRIVWDTVAAIHK